MTRKKITKKDLKKKVARLKKKIEVVSARLKQQQSRISSVQLQLDDLRRDGGLRTELASYESGQRALAHTAERLSVRVRDLEQGAARAILVGDELRARMQRLEGSTAVLAPGDKPPLRRTPEPADHLQVPRDQLQDLHEDLQRLRSRNDQLDTALKGIADELRHRTQAVEQELRRLADGQESLELKTALLSREAEGGDLAAPGEQPAVAVERPDLSHFADQLQALDKRLSELALETGRQTTDDAQLTRLAHSLEQQVSAVHAAQADDRSHLDHVLDRTDALEAQTVRQQDQTDALLQRTDALSGELQALRASGGNSRLDVLEQSLNEQRARIGELKQTEEALGERLLSAIGSAEALYERIDSLHAGSGQLAEDVGRLDGELQNTSRNARRHEERLQAYDARLGTLDQSQQALKQATDSLGVRQARQDNQTRDLQQILRKRSLLGLAALLLTALGIGYLLLRGPMVPEGPDRLVSSETTAQAQTAAAVTELRTEMSDLRQQLSLLESSVSQVVGTVDEISANAGPELPGQVAALDETVRTLVQEQEQRQQQSASLQAEQGQLRIDVDKIAGDIEALASRLTDAPRPAAAAVPDLSGQVTELQQAVDALMQESLQQSQLSAELQSALQALDERVKALAARRAAPLTGTAAGKPSAAEAAPIQVPATGTAAADTAESQRWEQAKRSGRYTLQLAGFHKRGSLAWFLQQHGIGRGSAVFQTQHEGRTWYALLYGIYDSVGQALAAARQLPAGLAVNRPWVRRIPPSGSLSPL